MHGEALREGLGAREQALLQANEGQSTDALLGRAQLGVASEGVREREVEGQRLPEIGGLAGLAVGSQGVAYPRLAVVIEPVLHQDALGELFDAERAQIALEAAHHDGRQILFAAHRDAAGEAVAIEDLEQGAEAVGVAVVRGGGEKEAVVEAGRELTDGAGDLAVHRVAAARGGRGHVRFVEHEQALLHAGAEVAEQGLAVLGATQDGVRDDEAVVGGPHRDTEAARLAALRDEVPAHHLEVQAEAAAHLVLPLKADGRGARDEDEVGLLAQDELLHDQARLDGLAEAHVIRDEEVGARELERLHQRGELMRHVLDARAERRLKAGGVRGRDRVPAEGVQVRAEVLGGIEARGLGERGRGLGIDHLGAQLEIPEHLQRTTGVVVVEAHQIDERRLVAFARRDVFDEPLAVTRAHHLAGLRQALAVVAGRRRRGALGIDAGDEQQALDQIAARAAGIGHTVRAADELQLVAAELAEDGVQPPLELRAQQRGELGLVVDACAQSDAEEAREVEDARLRERDER